MVVFISITSTAYVLLTAREEELERIVYEEIGGIAGGAVGGGFAVGACIVFGVATSGWGLLACGVIGGGVGGLVGGSAANNVYRLKEDYMQNSKISKDGFDVFTLDNFASSPL